MKIDFNSYFGKDIKSLEKFCEENHLTITDDGDGIFTKKDTLSYKAQPGDGFWGIARKFEGYNATELQDANGGNTAIKIGQEIIIPFEKDAQTIAAAQKQNTAAIVPETVTAKPQEQSDAAIKAKYKAEAAKTKTTKVASAPISFKDFGDVKTRKVNDAEVLKSKKTKSIEELQKDKYYVDDKNGNGIYDDGDILYKQVTIMLDAGHGKSKYLKVKQDVKLPNGKTHKTDLCETMESIAAAHKVDAEKLKAANKGIKNGYDPGAPSIGEHDEAYFNGVAREQLAEKLQAKGFDVVLAERADGDHIYERVYEKLSKKPDMYVSLHCDSYNKNSVGETAYYRNDDDLEFVKEINKELKANATFRNRGVKGAKDKDILVLRGDNKGEMRETLVELGFLSSQSDYDKLDGTGIDAQTDAIANGIENYYNKHLEK